MLVMWFNAMLINTMIMLIISISSSKIFLYLIVARATFCNETRQLPATDVQLYACELEVSENMFAPIGLI